MKFAKALEALVLPHEFRYVKKRNAFVRSEAHGFAEFLWTCHPSVQSDTLGQLRSLVVGVRHNAVENFVNQLGLVYGTENQQATATVSCPLAYFPLRSGQSYSLFLRDQAADSELQVAAAEVSTWLNTDLALFFSKYASLAECAQGLSSEPLAKSHALYNNYEPRMYRAIASSCLSQTSGVAEQLKYWSASYPSVLPQSVYSRVEKRLITLADLLSDSQLGP